MNVDIVYLEYEYGARMAVSRASPIVTSRGAPAHLTIPLVKRRYARDALLHTCNIGVFTSAKKHSATIKHIYDESVNTIEGCHDCWNFPITAPVIGAESMVTRARLRYTRDYLTPGICSVIKPAAMDKLMPFPAKLHRVMLKMYISTVSFPPEIFPDYSFTHAQM